MQQLINCPVCRSPETRLVYNNYPGYVMGTSYDIFECRKCNTSFINPANIDNEIYEKIYSNKKVSGYERYFDHAEKVKRVTSPLLYLSKVEANYYPVYKYLKGKKDLNILEIGCGYGYLTYSVNKAGFSCHGIDISESAVEYAKKNYGDFYSVNSVESFLLRKTQKYDLIIATELVEHLTDPVNFLIDCIKLLNENGKILLTTPNKNYYPDDFIWFNDLPPVHIYWFSRNTFKTIADELNLSIKFFNFNTYYSSVQNRYIKFLRTRHEEIQKPVLLADGRLNPEWHNTEFSALHKMKRWFVHNFPPVRLISNFIYNKIHGDEISLGILIEKNEIANKD